MADVGIIQFAPLLPLIISLTDNTAHAKNTSAPITKNGVATNPAVLISPICSHASWVEPLVMLSSVNSVVQLAYVSE